MFLRPNRRTKDGKDHSYWSLVETVRTPDGPRQKTLCYLGELNSSAQARWLKTIEVFNEQGEAQQRVTSMYNPAREELLWDAWLFRALEQLIPLLAPLESVRVLYRWHLL